MASLLIFVPSAQSEPPPPGWRLVWQDDFERFDEQRWEKVFSLKPTNHSLHAYLPELVAVRDGCLVITSTDEAYQTFDYRSGLVKSHESRQYGRWEVRAKLPATRGMWPAIWLLPDTEKFPWPSGGEIDILENRGDEPTKVSSAFHYGTSRPYDHRFVMSERSDEDPAGDPIDYQAGFHTYAVDWTSETLRFYVDGVCHWSVYDEDLGGFLSRSMAPAQLVINTAIGGAFLTNPDATTVWPQELLVDWVRVYEADPAAGPAGWLPVQLQNGGFEANGGSLAGWSFFGGMVEGRPAVRISQAAEAPERHRLVLTGQSSGAVGYSGVAQGVQASPGDAVALSATVELGQESTAASTLVLKLEFYRKAGGKHGSDAMISQHETVVRPTDAAGVYRVTAMTPPDAVETRAAIVLVQPDPAVAQVGVDEVALTSLTEQED